MKVKNNRPEYQEWKSEGQWAKLGKVILDPEKAETLWPNQYCSQTCLYAAPDNVRNMTETENAAYRIKLSEQRKAARIRKNKEAQYEEEAIRLRDEWHTPWQWLRDYHRVPNEKALYKSGQKLNNEIKINCAPFGTDYEYCHIDDTRLITDKEELEAAFRKSSEVYRSNAS